MLVEFDDDPRPLWERYVQVECEGLILAHFEDTLSNLQRWPADPIRLFLAARSCHSALVASLTSALAGSSSIGAFDKPTQKAWLAFFEDRKSALGKEIPPDRVLSFRQLIQRAQSEGGGWLERPLDISEIDQKLLDRLSDLRDIAEHPKPGLNAIEPQFILQTLPLGIDLAASLASTVFHRIDLDQQIRAHRLIKALHAQINILQNISSGDS